MSMSAEAKYEIYSFVACYIRKRVKDVNAAKQMLLDVAHFVVEGDIYEDSEYEGDLDLSRTDVKG